MKKFLSLVLALVMAMSLVTISAGATEYKDLTDKDEIQYEEAVAVLNRIGIITGYSDGSFRPTDELTRGAAAKIIVSLLIGSEAAENLTATTAPFSDVPVDYTFAGVIAFCKSENIISGYGDGTFQPGGNLTGYAFSKMLLGALGYDADLEGFNGAGWSMKVASLGNAAGLFNRLDFYGTETVNREEACQLALNTLKATMVEYTGGFNVVAGDATIVGNQTRTYVISNQEYATHINNRKASQLGNADANNHYTVEFGEEHFKDLRMDSDRSDIDDFGRPSNVWSYKKVTIGVYPVEPDFVYTTQVTHDVDTVTDATKVRALGLGNYEVNDGEATRVYVNGVRQDGVAKVADIADYTDNGTVVEVYVSETNADFIDYVVVVKTQLMEVKRIGADYVALDLYDDGSDAKGVKESDQEGAAKDTLYGYNQNPIDVEVNNVEVDDECYEALAALKAGDIVAVVPVNDDDSTKYDVSRVYVPETVTGSLDRVDTFGTVTKGPNATSVTVGGTEYDIALWNKDLYDIDSDTIKVTTGDVKLYLDEFGNALLAEDVGATTNFMVVGNYRQGLVNGQLITYANGWDINGEELSLNVGAAQDLNYWRGYAPVGTLVRYTSDANSNTAEWKIDYLGVFDVDYGYKAEPTDEAYQLKTSNTRIRLSDYVLSGADNANQVASRDNKVTTGKNTVTENVWTDGSIKFIYISADSDGEVDSIEFKSGMQSATNDELSGKGISVFNWPVAQACVSLKGNSDTVTADSAVKAVVIKTDSSDASVNNLLYIARYHGSATRDEAGNVIQGYEVAMMDENGKLNEDVVIYSDKVLSIGTFARYTKSTHEESRFDPFYNLKAYTEVGRAASVLKAKVDTYAKSTTGSSTTQGANKNLVFLKNGSLETFGTTNLNDLKITSTYASDRELYDGDGNAARLVNMKGAEFYDLTKYKIDSASEMFDVISEYEDDHAGRTLEISVALIFNDKVTHDDFRRAYAVIILDAKDAPKSTDIDEPGTSTPSTGAVVIDYAAVGKELGYTATAANVGTVSGTVERLGDGTTTATFTLTKPDWAYALGGAADVKVKYDIYVGDTLWAHKTTALNSVANASTPSNVALMANATAANKDKISAYTITGLSIASTNTTVPAGEISKTDALKGDVSIKITSIEWLNAAIKYVDSTKTAPNNGLNMVGLGTTTDECMVVATADTIDFQVAASSMGGKYTISGIETDNLDVDDYKDVTESSFTAAAVTTATVKAAGGEPVVVTITPTAAFAEDYNLTISGAGIKNDTDTNKLTAAVPLAGYFGMPKSTLDTGKAFGNLTLTTVVGGSDSATDKTVSAKGSFDVKVAIAAAGANATALTPSYKVTLKGITGATLVGGATKVIDVGQDASFTFEGMSADIEITAANITVEPVYMLHVTDVQFTDRTATIFFSDTIYTDSDSDPAVGTEVKFQTNGQTGDRNSDIYDVSIDGNKLVIILNEGESFGDADEIVIVEDTLGNVKVTGACAESTIVISVAAGGATSYKSITQTHS